MGKRAVHASDTQTAKHIAQSALYAHGGAEVFLPRRNFTADSEGSEDAGKGILLNSDGLIDLSLMGNLDELNYPTDTLDLNVTSWRHGLCPRLSGRKQEYLDGKGKWTVPWSVNSFSDLVDVAPYASGMKEWLVMLNSTEDGLEFGLMSFKTLTDTPSTYVGGTNCLLKVNSTTDAVEFEADLVYDGDILFIHDTSDADVTRGLVINQATYDDFILSLKSTGDVAHGVTGIAETDTYSWMMKAQADHGGLLIGTIGESNKGLIVDTAVNSFNTSNTTTAGAAIQIKIASYSGTGLADIPSTASNVFAVQARLSGAYTNVLLLDASGDLYVFGDYYVPRGATLRELSPIVQKARTVMSLTWDDTIRTLDFTTDTSAYARWALVSVYWTRTGDTTNPFYWYYYGETNAIITLVSDAIGSSNYGQGSAMWIPLDSSQRVDYKAPSNTTTNEVILFGYMEGTN